MVQTISSSLLTIQNLREGYMKILNILIYYITKTHNKYLIIYVPLIQPLIPKDPIRVLELILVNCKLDLKFPLNKVEE
jgi:hypothetical protein